MALDSGCGAGGVINDRSFVRTLIKTRPVTITGINSEDKLTTIEMAGEGVFTDLHFMPNATLNVQGLANTRDNIAAYRTKYNLDRNENCIHFDDEKDEFVILLHGFEILKFRRNKLSGLYTCSKKEYVDALETLDKNMVSYVALTQAEISLQEYLKEAEDVDIYDDSIDDLMPSVNTGENPLHDHALILTAHTSAHVHERDDIEVSASRRQIKDAELAKDVQERLGYPSLDDLAWMLLDNRIEGCQLMPEDAKRSYDLFGEPIARIKGVTVSRNRAIPNNTTKATIKLDGRSIKTQRIHADLMYIAGQGYLVTVSKPLDYCIATAIQTKSSSDILKAIILHHSAYGSHFVWQDICCDGEPAIASCAIALSRATGAKVDSAPGTHDNIVERKIRTIKNCLRCILNGLPYKLPVYLYRFAVTYAINKVNQRPNREFRTSATSWEIFHGRKLNLKRDLGVAFGKYCEIHSISSNNTMEQRTTSGIALYSLNNLQGSFRFFVPSHGDPSATRKFTFKTSHKWTELPMPEHMIKFMNTSATQMKEVLSKDGMPIFMFHNKPVEDVEETEEEVIEFPAVEYVTPEERKNTQALDAHLTDDYIISMKNKRNNSVPNGTTKNQRQNTLTESKNAQNITRNEHLAQILNEKPADTMRNKHQMDASQNADVGDTILLRNTEMDASQRKAADTQSEKEREASQPQTDIIQSQIEHQHNISSGNPNLQNGVKGRLLNADHIPLVNKRKRTTDDDDYIPSKNISIKRDKPPVTRSSKIDEYVNTIFVSVVQKNLTIPEALNVNPHSSENAIINEFAQLTQKNVFQYIHPSTRQNNCMKPIPCSMFLKEKWNPNGVFDKMKARLVAGGHKQNKTLYERDQVTAPTASIISILSIITMAASKGWSVGTCDVGGAYLNADMVGEDVYMKINKNLAEFLVKADQKAGNFISPEDGSILVILKKALYGTVQAGNLWYKLLSEYLISLGFERNPREPCVFKKKFESGEVMFVVIYVDDVLATCKKKILIKYLFANLKAKFNQVTSHYVDEEDWKINYVGLHLNFKTPGIVRITQPKFIEEILNESEGFYEKRQASTPADDNIFKVDESSSKLSEHLKKRFHHFVAQLLYLSNRSRPDLAVAVGFLTTRVSEPTEQDVRKLGRCLNYLASTKELQLNLGCEENDAMRVYAYADASYGVHADKRSQTGGIITYGIGAVNWLSNKQTRNCKSAAEAELTACSDYGSIVIGHRMFLQSLGLDIGPITFYQDNQATIKLIENGRSLDKRTAHVDISKFWLKDRITHGDIELEYKPTKDMIADILTKPLQGAFFSKLRNLLMGSDY